MHQHQIAVFNLCREHTDLRLQVWARIVVRDDEFAIGGIFLLRQRIISAECQNVKILVKAADKRTVVV